MSISHVITKNYDNFRLLGRRKNKPNSNPTKPNQSQFTESISQGLTSGKPYAKIPDFDYNAIFAQYEPVKTVKNGNLIFKKAKKYESHTNN